MYFKVFSQKSEECGRAPLIRIREESTVFDLKLQLEKQTQMSVGCLQIYFLNNVLGDEEMMSVVSAKCQKLGNFSSGDQAHDADVLVYYRDQLVCRMRYIVELPCGSPRMSLAQDIEMDDELEQESMESICDGDNGCTSQASNMSSAFSSASGDDDDYDGGGDDDGNCNKCPKPACPKPKPKPKCCPPPDDDEDSTCKDPCKIECCDPEGDEDRPPYAKVMPEDRRYGVVIVNEDDPCNTDFSCILIFLVEQFQEAEEASTLSFSQCTSAVAFDNSLLIVCEDADTQDWILRAALPMCPPFKCTTFIKHFMLTKCSFVLPMIVKHSLCRIFHIFEKQNCGLTTSKWCVMSKSLLSCCKPDYSSKVVYEDAPNLEIVVYIDEESLEYINTHCNKLRYMLWHLPFDCCHVNDCRN
ncbi:hypothetical protein KR009_011861 [Drosophila setifemur]|nr:hypothetical protein KR009_011861 [Drosophila setifemur]